MREDTTRALPRHRVDPNGHERAAPWRVRFADGGVRNLGPLQLLFDLKQMPFVSRSESDGIRVGWEVPRAALSSGVDELRTEDAEREVPANDAEVAKARGLPCSSS